MKVQGWSVGVEVNGEVILTIGHNHLSGAEDIDQYADVVRNAALHLLAFIGAPARSDLSPTDVRKLVDEQSGERLLDERGNADHG